MIKIDDRLNAPRADQEEPAPLFTLELKKIITEFTVVNENTDGLNTTMGGFIDSYVKERRRIGDKLLSLTIHFPEEAR